jgi:hypothetical protein
MIPIFSQGQSYSHCCVDVIVTIEQIMVTALATYQTVIGVGQNTGDKLSLILLHNDVILLGLKCRNLLLFLL